MFQKNFPSTIPNLETFRVIENFLKNNKMSEFLHPDLTSSHPTLSDSKLPFGVLRRLQDWISREYKNLSTMIQNDVSNCQFLRIMKSSPHPVLVAQPSLNLVCRANQQMQISCQVQSFNLITIKEIQASFEGEQKVRKVNSDIIFIRYLYCSVAGRA